MKTIRLTSLAIPLLASTLLAQGPQLLVGLTGLNPSLQRRSINCNALATCQLPGLPGVNNTFAGGIAWDAKQSGAWVTNGHLIAKYDDGCNPICAPIPVPSLGSVATYITGLDVLDSQDQLWMIDNQGRIRWYTNTCPPVLVGGCNSVLTPTTTPVPQLTTGIAIDEGIGLIFVAYPNTLTGVTRIAVNDLNNPCVQFDIIVVPPCFTALGAITGLTCDWGSNMLYATDGFTTVAINYAWNGSNLTVVSVNCCPATIALDRLVGLTVRPGRATSTGSSCNNGACPNCPMIHRLVNDPVLGNADFRLGLNEAFGNSFSFCLIGDGPCSAAGVQIPPLCGPIHTLPLLGYLGPNLIQGPSICGGGTNFNLPLPLTPSLVGQVYSSQCANLCLGAAGNLGFALSNCLSWELQGL